uniref:Uncharacterized protein n=1 Tax=Anguilla anguilla TaxID=7936 RepID=A0A0E9QJX2_ANGAN
MVNGSIINHNNQFCDHLSIFTYLCFHSREELFEMIHFLDLL